MSKVTLRGEYLSCQYEDKLFSLYFTYGDKQGEQYMVSKVLTNVQIVDKGVDANDNDEFDNGRPICYMCE
jgi:hypothetical protein